MTENKISVLIEAIRKGPPPVIGADYNGPSQKAFNDGWNAAKEQIWAVLQTLGLEPCANDDEENKLDRERERQFQEGISSLEAQYRRELEAERNSDVDG